MVRVPNVAPMGPLSQSAGSGGQNTCACAQAEQRSRTRAAVHGAASTRGRADRCSSATAQHGPGQETPSCAGNIGSADHLGSHEREHAAKPGFACPSERDPRASHRQTDIRDAGLTREPSSPVIPAPARSGAPAMPSSPACRLRSVARQTASRPPREGAPGSVLEAPRRTQPGTRGRRARAAIAGAPAAHVSGSCGRGLLPSPL